MLQIKNICKQYKTGDLIQIALNDVSLNLRDNDLLPYWDQVVPAKLRFSMLLAVLINTTVVT